MTVLDQRQVADPSRRVPFGTTPAEEDGWTYVLGGDDGRPVLSRNASLYRPRFVTVRPGPGP